MLNLLPWLLALLLLYIAYKPVIDDYRMKARARRLLRQIMKEIGDR